MVLRIIRNALLQGIVSIKDFEKQNLIQELSPLMNTRSRISVISKILSLLCADEQFR